MASIVLRDIVKEYGDGFKAVKGVSLDIADGPEPGVSIRSTEVQCLKVNETCVEGLDADGDGSVDRAVRRDTVFGWALDDQPMRQCP